MDATGHLTNDERLAYWQRTLPPAALLELNDHLQTCLRCREQLRQQQPASASDGAVPYEDLVGWMEGDDDPLRRHELAARISASPSASAELLDLMQFRDEMNALPAQDYSPALPPPDRAALWRRRVLAIAAGVVIGYAILWTASSVRRAAGIALVDHGRTFTARSDGQIAGLGPIPSPLEPSVREAILHDQIDRPPFWSDLRGNTETLAGPPDAPNPFRVLAPVGVVVESDRPTFRWGNYAGATGYRVNLVNKAGAVTSSPLLGAGATSWTPNESLAPNETYEWEVEAWRDGSLLAKTPAPPEPEARLRVLDSSTRAALQQLREKSGGSHFLMGLAYAHAGLQADAQCEFEEFARENPQSPLPKNLLTSLGSW